MTFLPRVLLLASILPLVLGAVACGGDDDDGDGGSSDDSGDTSELAFGDICELVPAAEVEKVVGSAVTGAPLGVGDGLPGAGCTYTGSGILLSLSVTPDGAGFYESSKSMPAAADIKEVDGLGEKAFIYLDTEVQAVSGKTLVQAQFPGGSGAGTHGVELIRRTFAAIP